MRKQCDYIALKLPIIGTILKKSAIARFSRTLSTMYAAGVPLVEAMGSVAGTTGNILFHETILNMREMLQLAHNYTGACRAMNYFLIW